MGSHKKHKYYKKKSKKSKKHKKGKINLKEIHDKLKTDKKYSNLLSTLSIKDKRSSNEKRLRSETSDEDATMSTSTSVHDSTGRRKIKYKYKKSRSSSMTSSSSSTSSYATSSSSSSPSSSSSSDEKQRKTKHKKKKLKKEEKKKKIELLNKKHEETKQWKCADEDSGKKNCDDFSYDKKRIKKIKLSNNEAAASVPGPFPTENLLQKSKAMAPMSREEWAKKQNEIRRVYDQETGRYRLIKGDGEVLEEIVSKSRHREINKQATQGDGNYFQTTLTSQLKK
uniref:ADP-ribosylation factor-like protein 6-interacting protein 4 n=1 Tax=Cacopsylla melanoneura TaxID=428564 RepID=A0A8D8M554_9HEMI